MTFFAVFGVSEFNASLALGFKDSGWAAAAVLISWFLTIIVLPILIWFVQSVDKYRHFFTCCPTMCFPVVQRSELDVDNMDRVEGRPENLGVPVLFGGHNLPLLVEIGLTDLPKSVGAMAPLAPPGTTPLAVTELYVI